MYNGKELNEELGLNWYAYGFRMYDPSIGRFPSVDPIADNFAFVSPFNYAENEPIGHIDLWGLQKFKKDAVPTGIKHINNAEVPSSIMVDRSRGIKAGDFTLYHATGGGDESDIQFWVANREYGRGGTRDEWFIGTESFAEFYQNPGTYKRKGNMISNFEFMAAGSTDDLVTNYASTWTPANILMGISMAGKALLPVKAPAVKSSAQSSASSSRVITVYHKGQLSNGKVRAGKSFSTGLDRASVEALERGGTVHQFDIPYDEYLKWQYNGQVQTLKDLDAATGVYNNEVRFSGSVSGELNKYLKNE